MESRIGIGVIGCGYWGPNLVRNFVGLPEAHVVRVADMREERLKHLRGLYAGLETGTDHKSLLEDPRVDAVAIATPVRTHFSLASEALEAGKHVLIEKPLTETVAQAEDLIALAEKQQRVLMVGHTFEYSAPVNRLRDVIASGELGRVFYISMQRLNLGLFQPDINVVWDLAPHDISIINYLLWQEPEAVGAHGSANYQQGREDIAFLFLRYPGNVIAHLHVSWLDPCKMRRTTVVGDKKMAVYDDLNAMQPVMIFDKGITKQPYYDTFGEFKLIYNAGDIHSPKIDLVEPLKVECSHFLECIRSGKKPRTDGSSGLRVVRVLEAAQRSMMANGQEVPIGTSAHAAR
jgi:predicted dehydrogenase